MKSQFSLIAIVLLFFGFSLSFSSCKEEKEEEPETPQIDRGPTEANRMVLIFNRVVSGSTVFEDSAEVYDPDGMGGNAPITLDSLTIDRFNSFNNPLVYEAEIHFYLDDQNVNGTIRANDKDFIVCYRGFQTQELQLRKRDTDSDGVFLGLDTEWITSVSNTSGVGTIRLTLNYQPLAKDGLCDAGIRIFEYNLPYRLK